MDDFIVRTGLSSDIERMRESLSTILLQCEWARLNQIGLNYRSGASDTWHDGAGSLYDTRTGNHTADEHDFVEWNVVPEYLLGELDKLGHTLGRGGYRSLGRVRFMRLLPKTGLSIHRDRSIRYHYVINTNVYCMLANYYQSDNALQSCGRMYHLPADGHWYTVNTLQHHTVYNGGNTERIHLVVCN